MEIQIQSGEELNLLLDALAQEIVDANVYHRLFCELVDCINTHEREFRQSNTFWHLTLDALRDARLTHLCRVYDQESKSLNLVNLLHTLKANLHLFSALHFCERLKGNAFVDSLAKGNRVPDSAELDADIESVTCRNSTVKKLMIWRNNLVAHRGAKVVMGKNQVLLDNSLTQEEIEHLLDHSFKTFNKYSSLYRAATSSRQINGYDDYKSLLKFIGLGLKKWDEDRKSELDEMRESLLGHA